MSPFVYSATLPSRFALLYFPMVWGLRKFGSWKMENFASNLCAPTASQKDDRLWPHSAIWPCFAGTFTTSLCH